MMFLFSEQKSPVRTRARSGLLSISILCLLFGMAIYAAPELLAYLVGGFFIIVGCTLLITWWNLR